MRIEVLLKLFVGKVNTKLLKAVGLENLKAENIQNSNRALAVSGIRLHSIDRSNSDRGTNMDSLNQLKTYHANRLVDANHQPVKQRFIHKLGKSISCVESLTSLGGMVST